MIWHNKDKTAAVDLSKAIGYKFSKSYSYELGESGPNSKFNHKVIVPCSIVICANGNFISDGEDAEDLLFYLKKEFEMRQNKNRWNESTGPK